MTGYQYEVASSTASLPKILADFLELARGKDQSDGAVQDAIKQIEQTLEQQW